MGKSPFPWHARTEDRWVYIHDANGKPVARVFGITNEARAKAEFIIAACQEKTEKSR